MKFKKGDIVEYCTAFFEIDEAYEYGGVVYELTDELDRTGLKIKDFSWNAYGEECKLVELNKNSL